MFNFSLGRDREEVFADAIKFTDQFYFKLSTNLILDDKATRKQALTRLPECLQQRRVVKLSTNQWVQVMAFDP